MKRIAALALPFAALFASASLADDKPLFVYVSPNPIGVNDFLKLGKIGTERVAAGARRRRPRPMRAPIRRRSAKISRRPARRAPRS